MTLDMVLDCSCLVERFLSWVLQNIFGWAARIRGRNR